MTHTIGRLVIAAVLLVAAWWGWSESTRMTADADAWQQLATLGNEVAPAPAPHRLSRWLPAAMRAADDRRARPRATADYWRRRYDDLVRAHGGDADPAVLHLAASAAYRIARRSGDTGAEAARQLDPVLDAYSAVLKTDPGHADAAWNYEFVARARDAIARARPAGRGRAAAALAGVAPPPAGASVHGVPGAPPPDVNGEDFETIAPMDFGDREAQPEATPGTTLKRKG